MPQEGRTIATDWNIIPAGSEVMINGNIYIVEDRGGAIKGNVIDVFVGTEAEKYVLVSLLCVVKGLRLFLHHHVQVIG